MNQGRKLFLTNHKPLLAPAADATATNSAGSHIRWNTNSSPNSLGVLRTSGALEITNGIVWGAEQLVTPQWVAVEPSKLYIRDSRTHAIKPNVGKDRTNMPKSRTLILNDGDCTILSSFKFAITIISKSIATCPQIFNLDTCIYLFWL